MKNNLSQFFGRALRRPNFGCNKVRAGIIAVVATLFLCFLLGKSGAPLETDALGFVGDLIKNQGAEMMIAILIPLVVAEYGFFRQEPSVRAQRMDRLVLGGLLSMILLSLAECLVRPDLDDFLAYAIGTAVGIGITYGIIAYAATKVYFEDMRRTLRRSAR